MHTKEHELKQIWQASVAEAHFRHISEKVALLKALHARFGEEVVEIVARVVSERARGEWQAIAAKATSRTPEDLIQLLWEPLRSKGFTFEVDRQPDGIQLTCTNCPIAEMARAIGDNLWLFHLVCGIDPAIVEGFNPSIGMRRRRTLMEGHDCCDHFYFVK